MADDAPPGSGSGNVLQPDSPGRALVRLALTGLTVAAALYFSIKTLCIDWPDACSHAAQYVPGWVFGEITICVSQRATSLGRQWIDGGLLVCCCTRTHLVSESPGRGEAA